MLQSVVRWGSLELLQEWVRGGVGFSKETRSGRARAGQWTHPILLALRSSRDAAAKAALCVAAGADPNGEAGRGPGLSGRSLLTWACQNGDLEGAEFLVRAGADPLRADPSGVVPRELAAGIDDRAWGEILGAAASFDSARDVEAVFILPDLYLSQIHEVLKWAIRAAGWQLAGILATPSPKGRHLARRFVYRLRHEELVLEVDWDLWEDSASPDSKISLLLRRSGRGRPLEDLLPSGQDLTASQLRGHWVTRLLDWRLQGGGLDGRDEGFSPDPASREALAVLGLGNNASAQQIQSAYRRLAKRFHPDRVPESSGREMKELNRAYESLKRKR